MRKLYNQRHGLGPGRAYLTRYEVADRLLTEFGRFRADGYFQRSFGFECVNDEVFDGLHGRDWPDYLYLNFGVHLGDPRVEGSRVGALAQSNATLFTVIEFIFDHMAKPKKDSGYYHEYYDCGWHFPLNSAEFDIAEGQYEWVQAVNKFLPYYGEGFELSEDGEILHLVADGFEEVVDQAAPEGSDPRNTERIDKAIRSFRSAKSSRLEQKEAVRHLADVLEFYKPHIDQVGLSKDASELFHIVNRFNVRHNKPDQLDDYGDEWLEWTFYTKLATLRLLMKLVHEGED